MFAQSTAHDKHPLAAKYHAKLSVLTLLLHAASAQTPTSVCKSPHTLLIPCSQPTRTLVPKRDNDYASEPVVDGWCADLHPGQRWSR